MLFQGVDTVDTNTQQTVGDNRAPKTHKVIENALLKVYGVPKIVSLPKLVEHQKTKFRSTDKIEGSFQMAVARLMWSIGHVTMTASIYREREKVEIDGKVKERRYLRATLPQGWAYDYRDEAAVKEVNEFRAICLDTFKGWAKTNASDLLDLSKAPANATTFKAASKNQPDGAEVFDIETV